MREIVLDEVPRLGSLYARALSRTAQAAVGSFASLGSRPTTLPSLAYVVEAVEVSTSDLADYQHLVGEPGVDELPPGFVHILGFPLAMESMVREDFPLPVMGMVHIANRIEQFHPLTVSDTLRIRAWAQDLRAHRSGVQVDLIVEVSGQDGLDVAWRGTSTYLAKGATIPGLALAEPVEAGTAKAGAAKDQPLPQPTAQWRFAANIGRRFAAVSGDRNPIHLSALSAKLFGFPRAIAHGMYGAARALAAVGPSRGASFVWQVAFAKPVLLPSTVALGLQRRESGIYEYVAWKHGSDLVHFTGSVRPLP